MSGQQINWEHIQRYWKISITGRGVRYCMTLQDTFIVIHDNPCREIIIEEKKLDKVILIIFPCQIIAM